MSQRERRVGEGEGGRKRHIVRRKRGKREGKRERKERQKDRKKE